jgi:hypothetical protein
MPLIEPVQGGENSRSRPMLTTAQGWYSVTAKTRFGSVNASTRGVSTGSLTSTTATDIPTSYLPQPRRDPRRLITRQRRIPECPRTLSADRRSLHRVPTEPPRRVLGVWELVPDDDPNLDPEPISGGQPVSRHGPTVNAVA